jgi:hypothetical protein
VRHTSTAPAYYVGGAFVLQLLQRRDVFVKLFRNLGPETTFVIVAL